MWGQTKTMNKNAMLDDFFDLVFTVIIAIFALLLINGLLIGGLRDRDRVVTYNVLQANSAHNLLMQQYVLYTQGEVIQSDVLYEEIMWKKKDPELPRAPLREEIIWGDEEY